MENIEYANAYSEVIEILKYIPKEDYNKIPKNKIDLFNANANINYKFQYNPLLTLDKQNVSKRAQAIIAILFRDYWATDKQREKIIRKQQYDLERLEEEKKQKYNPEDIFKDKVHINNDTPKTLNAQEIQEKQVAKYKKSFLKKIVEKFSHIFNRNRIILALDYIL